ncbi:hypothetical protein [Arthrobacter sp. R-11]
MKTRHSPENIPNHDERWTRHNADDTNTSTNTNTNTNTNTKEIAA